MLKPFSHILFRCPVQSLNEAFQLSSETKTIFREGLYLSSPEFWQAFQKRELLTGKEKEKLELSFAKYWLRSSVRCTPYGTFAGSAMASISSHDTNIILASDETHRRNLRLDMNYMAEIVNALVQMPEVRDQILFIPNNSLYPTAASFRYAEYSINNNIRSYQLTSVDRSPYLEKVLSCALRGTTLKDLAAILTNEEDVSQMEASEYINELWLSQLLIPLLEPTVTGAEPLVQVIAQLNELTGVDSILIKLKEIQTLLNNPEEGVDFYKRIEEKLGQLELGIKVPKNTVQADLYLNTHKAYFNENLITAIIQQAEDLKALSSQNKNAGLEDFKAKFYARYEDKEVPLAIVLDADLGIGYAGVNEHSAGAGEWIDGLVMAAGLGSEGGSAMGYLQQMSLAKYHDWIANDKPFIEITAEDIKSLKAHSKHYAFANSMFLMGSLLKREDKLDKEHFTFDVSSFGGPSAANLLGRFTHGDDQLCKLTKEMLEQEEAEHPDAIYAEIAHLPQARVGNILLRPVLRKYEIPYVGLSGVEKENQITIDDLYVSVQNGSVVLRSEKWNKRVIPRLSTAHNFGYNSLPVYKFLCDLQGQGVAYPNIWDWGNLSALKHLPRVVYKNLVLQKAIWKIEEQDIAELPEDKESYPDFFRNFCNKLKIPDRVVYKEGDNELLIFFTEKKGIELFLHYLKRYKNILVEEFLFTEENCVVHDKQGNPFTNELIIPLYNVASQIQGKAGIVNNITHSGRLDVQRSFTPYSQWLYFKVYCGAKSVEKILANTVLPFIEEGLRKVLFEKFFFIRYSDEGGGHIRIRFFNQDIEKQLPLYREFMRSLQPFVENGTVHKIMLDTYNRELERYMPELIEEAETLFYNDSLAVLQFINLLDGIDGEQYRMLFALRGVDMLLSDFDISLEEKGRLTKRLQEGFFKEFGAHPALQKQLNDRYRKHQQFFASHLNPDKDDEHGIDEAVEIFKIRSVINEITVKKILQHLDDTDDREKIYELLGSYIHMFINRLFIAQQRKYELVVYHFLERYYTSRIAITKKEKKHAVPVL
jgi:thiopeptide-type bacteriocin biosynthesis protein